jgi:hypothetical protein
MIFSNEELINTKGPIASNEVSLFEMDKLILPPFGKVSINRYKMQPVILKNKVC